MSIQNRILSNRHPELVSGSYFTGGKHQLKRSKRHPELVSGSYFTASKIKMLKQVQHDVVLGGEA
jgi:hypothetical protein